MVSFHLPTWKVGDETRNKARLLRKKGGSATKRPRGAPREEKMTYRKEYLEALTLLAHAFDLAEAQGAPRPVIVGGSAVEYYTGGELMSGDFDLVAADDEVVGKALLEVGFRREDRPGFLLGGFYHPELLIGVEFVSGDLFEGRTDRSRLQVFVVDEEEGSTVIFPPLEDMIADRLGQHASDPKGREDMLEQARMLTLLAETLDVDYLRKRVYEEHADPALIDRLMAEAHADRDPEQ
jgi:hypothetical protein